MSETTTMFDDGWASVELDEDLYPRDAVQGAAYVFLDRSYLFLEAAAPGRIRVRLKGKGGADTAVLAGELENEALAQAYRRRIASDQRAYIESIASRALAGAAGPPGLDDLLAMDIGADTAFDDPLGIAMSWEDKYKKKADKPSPGASEPSPDAPPAPAADAKAEPGSEPGTEAKSEPGTEAKSEAGSEKEPG
jgi:His-Xaa-Ser system protein HxsD